MTSIYMHRNKFNGKVYIGQTSKNVKYRWNGGLAYKTSRKFFHAIKKYGWENFEHIVICECEPWESDDLERAFIKKYDSVNNGYNLELGGIKIKNPGKETRERISKALKGRKFSEESIKKISLAQKGYHNSRSTEFKKGHKVSDELKRKLSEINKGRIMPWTGKPRSKEHIEKIRKANIGRHPSEETRAKLRARIPWNKGKHGVQKPSEKQRAAAALVNRLRGKHVVCVETGETFISMAEAARNVPHTSEGNISRAISKGMKSGGFIGH